MVNELARHSVSVVGIIVDDEDRVLITQRRDNGHWEPPGGVLELEETIEDGLRREIREETGLDVEVGPLTGVYKNMTRSVVALAFRCEPVAGNPRATDEVTDHRWMEREEVDQVVAEIHAVRVADALTPPDGQDTPVRTHTGLSLVL